MKSRWNIFRRSRTFVALLILSSLLLMGTGCPQFPPLQCDQNVSFSLEKGKCTLINAPCNQIGSWGHNDHYDIGFFGTPGAPTIGPTSDVFVDERFSSDTSTTNISLRRLCSTPFSSTLNQVQGTYNYSTSFSGGVGPFTLTIFDEGLLTVQAKAHCTACPFAELGTQVKLVAYTSGGTPPYTFAFTANGDPILPISTNPQAILHSPTRNTVYKVTVRDSTLTETSSTVVVKVLNAAGQPRAQINAPNSTTPNTPTTINPSPVTGNIIRWQWDTDWHGDDGELFDTTFEGPVGTITVTWTTTGTKYVRLRVTDAQGNFNESFVPVNVGS